MIVFKLIGFFRGLVRPTSFKLLIRPKLVLNGTATYITGYIDIYVTHRNSEYRLDERGKLERKEGSSLPFSLQPTIDVHQRIVREAVLLYQ